MKYCNDFNFQTIHLLRYVVRDFNVLRVKQTLQSLETNCFLKMIRIVKISILIKELFEETCSVYIWIQITKKTSDEIESLIFHYDFVRKISDPQLIFVLFSRVAMKLSRKNVFHLKSASESCRKTDKNSFPFFIAFRFDVVKNEE